MKPRKAVDARVNSSSSSSSNDAIQPCIRAIKKIEFNRYTSTHFAGDDYTYPRKICDDLPLKTNTENEIYDTNTKN